jgi:hypothetical protein
MVIWPEMCLYRFGFLLIGYFGCDSLFKPCNVVGLLIGFSMNGFEEWIWVLFKLELIWLLDPLNGLIIVVGFMDVKMLA